MGRKRKTKIFTVREKLEIVMEAANQGIKPTARKYNISPSQLRQWRDKRQEIQKKIIVIFNCDREEP